jgi:hypothetical protein
MAKIEIQGTAERLDDIAVFLKNNHIEFTVVDDFIERSPTDNEKYRELMMKYNH